MSEAAHLRGAAPPTPLVTWVRELTVQPLDALHLAALLEGNGWTDHRARASGYDDVFSLAEALYGVAAAGVQRALAVLPAEGRLVRLWKLVRLYVRGLSFAAPMLLCSFSVMSLHYSLWSYLGFDLETATAIAIATFGSFFVAGGFTQAIARRGLFYISQDQYGLARRSSMRLVLVGVVAAVGLTVLVNLLLVVVPVLPWRIIGITTLYFLPMTFIWLGVCLLYMLHREPLILLLVGCGILLVYLLFERLHMPMMQAQVLSITAVAAAALLTAFVMLRRIAQARDDADEQLTLPNWSQVSRSLAPFFAYGTVYFALVFLDRILAWTKPGIFHPFFIWFEGNYELGLDWALWTLVLPMGLVEIYIDGLSRRVLHRAPVTPIARADAFNRRFRREHLRMSLFVLIAGLAGMGMTLLAIRYLTYLGLLTVNPLDHPVTRFVFWVGAPAFSLITVGLQNVLVLFSFNLPWAAVRACARALAGNAVVGFLASRYFDFHWAVLGLATGAILFAYYGTREAFQVFDRLDYHLSRGT